MNSTQLILATVDEIGLLKAEGVDKDVKYAWLKSISAVNTKYVVPMVILCGIVGNLLALLVFVCSPLRRLTISVYLAVLSLTDFIFLVFLGFGWLDSLQINIFALDGLCEVMVYVTYVVSFLSLWLIVTFTAELYLSIHCTHLHKIISRPKRAMVIAGILVLVPCCLYLYAFWMTESTPVSGIKIACEFNGSRSVATAMSIIDSFLTLIFPFSLLIYMNVRILYTVVSVSRRNFDHHHVPRTRVSRHGRGKSENLLAKLNRMAAKGRRGISKNSSKALSKSSSSETTRVQCRKKLVRRTSLTEGEIKINNDKGQIISVAKLVVKNAGVGITIEKTDSVQEIPRRIEKEAIKITMESNGETAKGNHTPVILKSKQRDRKSAMAARPHHSRPKSNITTVTACNTYENRRRRRETRQHPDNLAHTGTKTEKRVSISKDLIVLEPFLPGAPEKRKKKDGDKRSTSLNPLTKLQRKCFKMVVSVALVFLILNLPSHAIRLQGLVRSLFDPSYRTSELEFYLQHLLQTIYYLNFVVNVVTYSACAKSFRTACVQLPWHISKTTKQIFKSCFPRKKKSSWARQRQLRDKGEHSRLVEICIPELHLSEIPAFAPNYKHMSPPCLLELEPLQKSKEEKCKVKKDSNCGQIAVETEELDASKNIC